MWNELFTRAGMLIHNKTKQKSTFHQISMRSWPLQFSSPFTYCKFIQENPSQLSIYPCFYPAEKVVFYPTEVRPHISRNQFTAVLNTLRDEMNGSAQQRKAGRWSGAVQCKDEAMWTVGSFDHQWNAISAVLAVAKVTKTLSRSSLAHIHRFPLLRLEDETSLSILAICHRFSRLVSPRKNAWENANLLDFISLNLLIQ